MKRTVLVAGMAVLSISIARADDDALLRLLVRKHIITEQEAREVKSELAQEKKASPEKVPVTSACPVASTAMP